MDTDIQKLMTKIDELGAGIREEIEPIRLQVEGEDGTFKKISVQVEKQETWLKELETQINKHRFSGSGEDGFKAALGERFKHIIGQAEIAAMNHRLPAGLSSLTQERKPQGIWADPVKTAACAVWVQLKLLKDPRVQSHMSREFSAEDREVFAKLSDALNVQKATNPMLEQATFGLETVPTPLEAEVLRQIEDAGQVRALVRKLTMRAVTHNIPDLTTGISVTVVAENVAGTNVRPIFGQKALTAKKVMALGAASIEVLQDSAIDMFDFWLTLANEQMALKEDLDFLEGAGGATEIGTGVLNATGVGSIDMPTGASPQPIDAGDWDVFIDAKYKGRKASTRSRRFNTGWFGAPEAARDLEKLQDSNNRPLLQTPLTGNIFALPEGSIGVFLGFPFYANSNIAINRGAGTDETAVYFGPWGRSFIVGDLLGMQIGTSEHVGWTDATIGIRLLKRTAQLVAVPADFTKVDRILIVP